MDASPETWRWIWLAAAVVLIAGEMAVPGTFILIPFGISALVAMVLSFAGVHVAIGWLVFVVLGGALFALFWKMGLRSMTDMAQPTGAGVDRLVGAEGRLVEAIPDDPSESGLVKLGGEQWRAVSDEGPIPEDAVVEVTAVRGTRVVVRSQNSTGPTPTGDHS